MQATKYSFELRKNREKDEMSLGESHPEIRKQLEVIF